MGELEKRFGARLREARQAKGMTQVQLGEAAGSSEEWVRRLERGEGSPSFDKIEALGTALGVDAVEFFQPATATRAETLMQWTNDLSSAEVDWLIGLIAQVKKRPGR